MNSVTFDDFFQGQSLHYLLEAIDLALREDGRDLTSRAVFSPDETSEAVLVAKQDAVLAGLPLLPIVLEATTKYEPGVWDYQPLKKDGEHVSYGERLAVIKGGTRLILKAERVMLNFVTHLSGIATLTATYAEKLAGSKTRLLDTRKTQPCQRYPEKYAVLMGGGFNHRANLEAMLMLKDNHIDAAGGISNAVELLRRAYDPCPPIEVECRTLEEVREAVNVKADRIMLDNMNLEMISRALALIPDGTETEVSGGVSLESIGDYGALKPKGPDFVSVGRLTHSAPVADFSLLFT